ncbi:apolipoprotein N-acyltransferase [Sulfitobacter geojensis]|uniref:apolipoprotein N-acyltransferase n=1 Tax=Sulfitobacter geojensis TaxID=1342299 RepID=UPI000468A56E|nr:apolipoprotein N-acyltransferase [Sulfitobacter geojensis]NYI28015.1 apolipoprotein N-acyltransferase [Sulfitobacter geojensis]
MTLRLAVWQMMCLAAALGAIAAFGQAPYDQPLILMAALVGALYFFSQAESPRQAAVFGWAFGTGYFAHALQWIVSPFMVDVARHGWMAPFALLFLAAGLALFWGLAFWLARRLSGHSAWGLVLTFPAVELVRAYIFTGFPWAMFSQSLVDSSGGQALSWIGPYALNLVMIAVAVPLSQTVQTWVGRTLRYGAILLGLGGVVLPVMAPDAVSGDGIIRLIQPNAAQRDKWDPAQIPVFFDRQLKYTSASPTDGRARPDLVLWSETAIPWVLDRAAPALDQIAQAGDTADVALGVQRRNPDQYFNSMVVLDSAGSVAQTYDKHHLVPFGEYMPFADLFARVGVFGLAQRALGGYASGLGPQLLEFGDLGRALPLICYEAVFAHDVNAAPERPDFLIQITNDAWFGKAAGPRQHLAQARMRAIEQGLPLARAANTGISAMIDPYGRVLAALPLNEAGFIDANLPLPRKPTLYSRTGDLPFAVVLLLGLVAAAIGARNREDGLKN